MLTSMKPVVFRRCLLIDPVVRSCMGRERGRGKRESMRAHWRRRCGTDSFLAPMLETPTAVVALSDGIITVRIRAGARQSLSDAERNLSAALEQRAGKRRPLLIDIREAVPLDAEVRR